MRSLVWITSIYSSPSISRRCMPMPMHRQLIHREFTPRCSTNLGQWPCWMQSPVLSVLCGYLAQVALTKDKPPTLSAKGQQVGREDLSHLKNRNTNQEVTCLLHRDQLPPPRRDLWEERIANSMTGAGPHFFAGAKALAPVCPANSLTRVIRVDW